MRQLARTLLILGSVSACERAQPLEDMRARPAVGNIGQTGRPAPRPAAIAAPLVDHSGAPAVGNIGQTGAPKKRRVQRVQRSVHHAPPAELRDVKRPLVSREERPMVGNVMSKGGAGKRDLAIVDSTSAAAVAAQSPLTDRRQRPAVGNMGRRGHLEASEDNFALMKRAIAFEQESLRIDPDDADAKRRLEQLRMNYQLMRHEAHEAQQAR